LNVALFAFPVGRGARQNELVIEIFQLFFQTLKLFGVINVFFSANAKEKTVAVRVTISGVVPRRLVPEKTQLGKKTGGTAL